MEATVINILPNRRCYCDRIECEALHQCLQVSAPLNHPWRIDMIRVQLHERNPMKMSDKKKWAFLESIHRHQSSSETIVIIPSDIWIHPHHFPTSLLEYREDMNIK